MVWYNPFSWFGSDEKETIENSGQQVNINETINTNNDELEGLVLYICIVITICLLIKLNKTYVKYIEKRAAHI